MIRMTGHVRDRRQGKRSAIEKYLDIKYSINLK
jgi:hypothetical protein